MLGGADNPNGELPSYITGANRRNGKECAMVKSPYGSYGIAMS